MGAPDIIVVGAGTAGLPLAIEAADHGRSVLVLDKADEIGGTLHVTGGHMSAAGTRRQLRRGITDSVDAHVADVRRLSQGGGDLALLRLAADEAAASVDWLDDLGFDFDPDCPDFSYQNVHEPYSAPRLHWGREGGRSILAVLAPAFRERVDAGAIRLLLGTRVDGLVTEDDVVVGVRVEGPDGAAEHRADAVVLTTGGYGASEALMRELSAVPLVSVAMPTSTGDGLRLAREQGARLRGGELYLPTFGGLEDPDEPTRALHWDHWPTLTPQVREPWEIYVNVRGERFVAEDEPDVGARERALMEQPDLVFWVVLDEEILEQAPPLMRSDGAAGVRQRAKAGHPPVTRASSLEELAATAGIDAAGLVGTVSEYNASVAAGTDALGRQHLPCRIERPPFYAIENHGTTLRTPGGVVVDTRLRVLRADGGPVEGLYAAGEVLGGATFAGRGFAAGMSVTPAISFARLLARQLSAAQTP